MSEYAERPRPAFRGLNWYRDPHCSFLRPLDWQRFTWLDDRQGVLFGPDPDNSATLFAIDVKEMGIEVTHDDIPDLEACSAFGATPEEALRQVEQAKAAWLEAARAAGKPIPPPRYRPAIYQSAS